MFELEKERSVHPLDLDRLLDLGLVLGLGDSLSGLGIGHLASGLLVSLHQPGPVKLGPLEDLHLASVDLLHGVDRPALLDDALQLVGGQAHAVERAQAVLALDIVADESELPEAPLSGLLLLQVSQGHLEDTSLQSIGGDLGSLSP